VSEEEEHTSEGEGQASRKKNRTIDCGSRKALLAQRSSDALLSVSSIKPEDELKICLSAYWSNALKSGGGKSLADCFRNDSNSFKEFMACYLSAFAGLAGQVLKSAINTRFLQLAKQADAKAAWAVGSLVDFHPDELFRNRLVSSAINSFDKNSLAQVLG
jgi:hypothetical protein